MRKMSLQFHGDGLLEQFRSRYISEIAFHQGVDRLTFCLWIHQEGVANLDVLDPTQRIGTGQ